MAKKNYAPNSNDTILSSVIGWKPPVLHQKSECYISFLAFDPGVNRMRKKKLCLTISRASGTNVSMPTRL